MSKNRPTCVRGTAEAMQRFRYEIAKEIGIGTSPYEKSPKLLKDQVITDAVSKRMIDLAEQQM